MKNFPWRPFLLTLWALTLIIWLNHEFDVLTSVAGQMGANDSAAIADGFRKTPHFWSDFWVWWRGPWIQSGVQVFRPLSSMMLWWECYVGFNYGFVYVAWWGLFLFGVACALTMSIAWRLTKSWVGVAVAATIVPMLRLWNWQGTTPKSWLAWMPVHHDLLMILGLLAAFWQFCWWLETGQRRHLAGCWLAFVAGAFSKEYVYIFPFIALIWGLGAPSNAVSRAQMLRAVGTMGAFTLALFFYRYAVLPEPYNPPPLKWVHFKKRPFLYWFGPFYGFVLTGMWWAVAQVLVGLAVTGVWLRAWKNKARIWPTFPIFAAILLSLALPFLAAWPLGMPPQESFWYFLDFRGPGRIVQSCGMIGTAWALWLVWKYRKQEPSLAALLILMAIYLPVFTYLGWHYTLTGAFVRGAIWWPIIAHLAARDIAGWLRAKSAIVADAPSVVVTRLE